MLKFSSIASLLENEDILPPSKLIPKTLVENEPVNLEISDFVKITQIGQGAYGDVWLADDWKRQRLVALKRLKLLDEREGFARTSIREIALLNSLKHPHIVTFHGVCHSRERRPSLRPPIRQTTIQSPMILKLSNEVLTPSACFECQKASTAKLTHTVWMVFEYLPYDLNGLLEQLRSLNLELSADEVKVVIRDLLLALQFCHEKSVIHRDIKSANLLITAEGRAKLADFGLARRVDSKTLNRLPLSNRVITLWYRPPEILLGSENYDTKVDVWSAGCIMGELLLNRAMFGAANEFKVLKAISDVLGPPDEAAINRILKHLPLWKDTSSNPFVNKVEDETSGGRVDYIWQKIISRAGIEGANLLKQMLSYDPRLRPSAAELLDHPWFKDCPACLNLRRLNLTNCHAFSLRRLQRPVLWRRQQPRVLSSISFLTNRKHESRKDEPVVATDPPAGGGATAAAATTTTVIPPLVHKPSEGIRKRSRSFPQRWRRSPSSMEPFRLSIPPRPLRRRNRAEF